MICPLDLHVSYLIIIIIFIRRLTRTTTCKLLNMMNHCKAISDYYRYYEPANKKGLKYDMSVDYTIIAQLTYHKSINSGRLKQVIEQSTGRKISPDTFYGHLNVLVDC